MIIKKLNLLLVTIIFVFAMNNIICYADILNDFNPSILDNKIIEVTESFEEVTESDLCHAEVLIVNQNIMIAADVEKVAEILDNGTEILVSGNDYKEVFEKYHIDNPFFKENQDNVIGCYLRSNGDIYCGDIIVYDLVKESDNPMTEWEYVKALKELGQEEINVEKLLNDVNAISSEEKLENLQYEVDVAELQADLGSAFIESNKFVYLYKKGTSGGISTSYKYSSERSVSGYSQIASVSMDIYAVKINTISTYAYDNIGAVCAATGLNGKAVQSFKVSVGILDTSNASIIDWVDPDDSSDTSVSGSIGAAVDGSGNVNSSYSQSYTYNPQGMKVESRSGVRNRKTWYCEPVSMNYGGKTYKIKPAIMLKNKSSVSHTISLTVDQLILFGGIRTYTMNNTVSCSITIKNHSKYNFN